MLDARLDELRRLEQPRQPHACFDAQSIEHVDEILGREIAAAPGAKGQPPSPPAEASKSPRRRSSAASTLASAVPRVS